MVNSKHLKLIKQGVERWNQWRKENSAEMIDLHGAALRGANLTMANLSETNLSGAILHGATLRGANLTKANLSNATLTGADLHGATLLKANLVKTNLSRTVLSKATLNEANLNEADLHGATLFRSSLVKTNLNRAVLSRAVLSGTDLRNADLRETIFYRTSLVGTNLSEANITGAYLFGTVRDDWIIDGIKCEYVFWDKNGKERTPSDRDFRPGEFEEFYRSLPIIEYYFEHDVTPIDAFVMDRVVQDINKYHPEFELRLTALDFQDQPHAAFNVIHKDYAEEALREITKDYETQIKVLQGQRDQANVQLQQFMATLLDNRTDF